MLAKAFRASEMSPTSYTDCPNYEHTITIAAGREESSNLPARK
jgi:hypothetical protein